MKRLYCDKEALITGIGIYLYFAVLAYGTGVVTKPKQTVRDMFNPISNGYYIERTMEKGPDGEYYAKDSTYLYNPDYVGKLNPMAPFCVNMAGLAFLTMGLLGSFEKIH